MFDFGYPCTIAKSHATKKKTKKPKNQKNETFIHSLLTYRDKYKYEYKQYKCKIHNMIQM